MSNFRDIIVIIATLFVLTGVEAQVIGAIGVDVQPGAPVFRPLSSQVDDPSSSIETTLPSGVSLKVGETKSVLVRLNGTQKLAGVFYDLQFDSTRLEMVKFRGNRGDLNFNGFLDPEEVAAAQVFFAQYGYPQTPDLSLFEYQGMRVGAALDFHTRNNLLDPEELNALTVELAGNKAVGGNGIPFWTQVRARQGADLAKGISALGYFNFGTSVNQSGMSAGNFTMLLPDRNWLSGGQRPGLGFNGNAILAEVVFRVKSDAPAGDATIRLLNALAIDENAHDAGDLIPVQTVSPGSALRISGK